MDFPERPRSGSRPRRRQRRERESAPGEDVFLTPERASDEPPEGEILEPAREEEREPAGFNETLKRVLWALPWIAFAITIVIIGELPFALAMVLFSWVGLAELFQMTARAKPFLVVGFAAAAGMIAGAHFGDEFHMVLAGVAFFPVMFAFAITRELRANVTYSMAVTVFGIIWIGLPFAHAVLLRELPDHGAALLVDVLIATFVADTAAYAGGRMFGSRPLAPSVSPNKTVEGLLIGIVAGTLAFWFAGLYQDWLPGTDALMMGLLIALIAPIGDLFESLVKRDLDVKDTGKVFGPHGGVLDRLDAVLFTVVAGYYLSLLFVY